MFESLSYTLSIIVSLLVMLMLLDIIRQNITVWQAVRILIISVIFGHSVPKTDSGIAGYILIVYAVLYLLVRIKNLLQIIAENIPQKKSSDAAQDFIPRMSQKN